MVTNAHTPSQQIRPPYLRSTERTNGKRKEGKAAGPAEVPVALGRYFLGFCLLPERLTGNYLDPKEQTTLT